MKTSFVSVTTKYCTLALPYEASVMHDYFVYLLTENTPYDAVLLNLDARYSNIFIQQPVYDRYEVYPKKNLLNHIYSMG